MKKLKKCRIDFKMMLIFLIIFFKYIKMQKSISNSFANIIFLIIIIIIMMIMIKKRILKNFNKNWLIISLGITIIQVIALQDIDLLILLSVSLIFLEDKDAINKIIKYYSISLMLVFVGTIIFDKIGLLQYKTISRLLDGNVRVQRNSLGFVHPNEAYIYFFYIAMGIYYFIKSKKMYIIGMSIFSILMYSITLSRTGLICSLIFIILIIFYNNKIKLNRFAFLIGSIITIILAFKYGKGINNVNELLSGRPEIYYYYITNSYIFNFIGNRIIKGLPVDNMYLNIILGSGWIIYIYYYLFYYFSGKLIEKDRKLTVIFIMTAIYGCLESHSINIGLNFMMLVQMYCVITKKNKLKDIE